MRRVSSMMNNANTQSALRTQESKLNRKSNQIGSERRLQELREDPIAAGHLVRYQSYLGRVKTFEKNARTLTDKFNYSEGYMANSLELLQRVRELAVGGANGTYNKEDLKNMGTEVDQLLRGLIQNANAVSEDGNAIFAGTNTKERPFTVELGHVEGSGTPLIENVRYNGNIDTNKVEVDESKYMELDNAGNGVFWAEKQRLFGGRDVANYKAPTDSIIKIDGVEIEINRGDNAYAVAGKINSSMARVKASIDSVTRSLNLETTDARELWMEDVQGGVLETLGILKDASQKPPYNLTGAVKVSGGSMFDAVIALRDALLKGDTETVGGRVLGTLDSGINNLTTRLAKLGSQYELATNHATRNSNTALNVTREISREGDLDYTEAITDLKMLDYAHQATLNNAGKMFNNTLLNYIR